MTNIAAALVLFVPIIWFFPVFIIFLYLQAMSDWLRHRKFYKINIAQEDILVFVLLVLCSISFINVDLAYRSPQNYLRYYLGTYLFPSLAYFALRFTWFTDKKVRSLHKAIFISGALLSLCCLFETFYAYPLVDEFDNPSQWIEGYIFRAGSLVGGSVHAGATMASLVALTLPFIIYIRKNRHPFMMLALLGIELIGLGVTFSRAGYIAVLICIIAVFLLLRGFRSRVWLPVFTILLLLFVIPEFFDLPDWLSGRLLAPDSSLVRIPRFMAGIDFLWDNIQSGWQTALFGRGYIASYLWGGYFIQPGYSIVTGSAELGSDYFLEGGFHNGYLTLLVDQGIIAFICYVLLIIISMRKLFKFCKQLRGNYDLDIYKTISLEPVGWGLIIIVHLVTETVHWQFYFPQRFYFYMALAMLCNLTSPSRVTTDTPGGEPE